VMLAAEPVCEICGEGGALVVDHCHLTGRVRGLLCARHCNLMLGHARDNTTVLARAIEYLAGVAPAPPVAIGTSG
jgi:Recombination endonuclease VII